jgi:hypothetical protein
MAFNIDELIGDRVGLRRSSRLMQKIRKSQTIQNWTFTTQDDMFSPDSMNNPNKIFIGV